jgi:hypothetical protein
MNDNIHCGNHEALVAYLYDEADRADREAMTEHLARCVSCAEEIESLRSTRAVLAGWAVPEQSLGFQITRPAEHATVLRPAAWWRNPLPAWAQAAAAVLIFAAGMTLGSSRGGASIASVAAPQPASPVASRASDAAAVAPVVTRDELVRLEQRLGRMEAAQPRTVTVQAASPSIDEDALLGRVQALIEASEERQRRENITLIGNVVRDYETQRRVDLRGVEERLGRIQGTTGLELQQHRDALNYIMRVSQTGR